MMANGMILPQTRFKATVRNKADIRSESCGEEATSGVGSH
jgi:hypothetical protein